MTRLAEPQQLLVDPAVLSRLRGELDDDEGWFLFIQRFIAQLPFRVRKLSTGLLTGDHGLAMDAVLSLKISSQWWGPPGSQGWRGTCSAASRLQARTTARTARASLFESLRTRTSVRFRRAPTKRPCPLKP